MKKRATMVLPLLVGLLASVAVVIMLSPGVTRAAVKAGPPAVDSPALEFFTRTVAVAQSETGPNWLDVSGNWVGWTETTIGCGHCGSYVTSLQFENVLTDQKVQIKNSTWGYIYSASGRPVGATSVKLASPYVVWTQPGKTVPGDGYTFAEGDFDCTVCYFDLSTGKGGAIESLQKLDPSDSASLTVLDMTGDGKVLTKLAGSGNLWAGAISGVAATEVPTYLAPGEVQEAVFAPSGRYAWITSDKSVYLNDPSGTGRFLIGTGGEKLVGGNFYIFWHTAAGIQSYHGDPRSLPPTPNGSLVVPGASYDYDVQTTTALGDIAAWQVSGVDAPAGLNVVSFDSSGGTNKLLAHTQDDAISMVSLDGDKLVYMEMQFTPSFPTFSIQLVWLVRSNPVFQKVWDKADGPVAAGKVARSWLWGPQANYLGMETYVEGENSERLVRYYDKSRMEVNHPGSNSDDPYYVTNGLLVTELIANEIQLGDNEFITATVPSTLPVAGDPRKDNPLTPGYQALRGVSSLHGENQSPNRVGQRVDLAIDVNGIVSADPAHEGVSKYAAYAPQTGHNIPDLFWSYLQRMQADYGFDWTFVMGYPISEAYWTQMRVNGQDMPVMIQAYQRRVLTYTPGFAEGWQVEMGNVGQHYFEWRYELNK